MSQGQKWLYALWFLSTKKISIWNFCSSDFKTLKGEHEFWCKQKGNWFLLKNSAVWLLGINQTPKEMCASSICSSSLGSSRGKLLGCLHATNIPLTSTPCQALLGTDADGIAGLVGQGPGGGEALLSVQRWARLPRLPSSATTTLPSLLSNLRGIVIP